MALTPPAAKLQFAWGAVKDATLKLYPDGNAKDTGAHEAALCLGVGRSLKHSAYMPELTDSTAVTDAFGRCIDIVRDGRGALSHERVIPVRPVVARLCRHRQLSRTAAIWG